MLLALAIRVALIYQERHDNSPTPEASVKVDPDELVFLKKQRPSSLADEKQLIGKTIWVSAAGQMDYYPATGHHADYAHSAGTLLGAAPLTIKDAFEQVAPTNATFRIPGGDKHVLLAFTLPNSSDPAKLYAVPVGYRKGGDYTLMSDEIFFYDDPHQLFNYWGPKIWQAIDSHQVILRMNERQVALSLGQVSQSTSQDYGNRMVVYDNLGKPMAVTFVGDHVTAFRPDQGF
jgi:hypothetical protein